ncbi:MAG TPA: AI-2E family transporter [Candidatus Paceibacterota bacterium]
MSLWKWKKVQKVPWGVKSDIILYNISMGTSSQHFFTGLLLTAFVLAVIIFLPFLTPIILAISLSIIFGPMHRFILRVFFRNKERSTFAALISMVIVGLIVLVPGFFIVNRLYIEIQDMYYYLTEESGRAAVITFLNNASDWFSDTLFNIYPAISFESLNVTEYLQDALEWAFSNIDTIFGGVTKLVLSLFIILLALFYFLRDGREFRRQIISLSPLGDTDDERILNRLERAVYSIVAGSLIVGVIQGILTGIGFALFHVPNPTVWGSIAAVAALIPGVGTSLIIIPGVLYLFFTGSTTYAVGLLIWGLVAVGLIDNLLGPVLINRGVKIHPFLILLSVFGGIAFFGLSGFILGPLILAFLFALLEIYRASRKTV